MRPTAVKDLLQNVARHPQNEGRVLRTFAQCLRFEAEARLFGRQWQISYGRARIIVRIDHYSSVLPLQGTPPDWWLMRFWENQLHPGDTFLDVGANVGIYSLWLAQTGATCIAIEPEPATLDVLKINVALNPHLDLRVVGKALSDTPGTVHITGGDVLNRIAPDCCADGTTVEATTVDYLIGDATVAGMKVDVEGAERRVLTGAMRALGEHRIKAIQLEWNETSQQNFGESRSLVRDLLSSFGYQLYRSHAGELRPCDGSLGQDVIALPSRVQGGLL